LVRLPRHALILVAVTALLAYATSAEELRAHIRIVHESGSKKDSNAHVVVWLTPIGQQTTVTPMEHVRLVQRDKRFIPHLLVITTGTKVQFPNQDPFFHNVFSLYKGKRFDLGLYEAGSSRSVEFDKPGVSFIFCNIHPEMSGLILVLNTPYFGESDKGGDVVIHGLPPGRYRMNVWYERSTEEALTKLAKEVVIPSQREVGMLEVPELVPENVPHKNKYGKDYDPNELYKQ
jgi:plastocyanin